jgi:serine/threonine protein phosphatase 1
MPFTYVIPDLHGRYDLLMEAVVKIIEHSKVSRSATIVTLGDYVDRGPKSRKIIERLMDWISPDLKLICLKGNHEDMMWQCCHHPIRAGWWMENGGGATLVSYGQREGEPVDVTVVPEQHLCWMDELPLMHVDRHRVYVHAGVNPDLPLDAQDPQELLWKRYRDIDDQRGHDVRHVVHGHHPFKDGPITIEGRTNLDTLAWHTGRLVVGVFDDDVPGGPVSLLEVRGEPVEANRRIGRGRDSSSINSSNVRTGFATATAQSSVGGNHHEIPMLRIRTSGRKT